MARSWRKCSYWVEDDIHVATANALVTANGSKATLWTWDKHSRRYDLVDRLLKAQISELEEVVITGESQALIEQGLNPSESKIVVHVKPRPCASCG